MIRVAFFVDLNDSWLGGVNYFRNLLRAVAITDGIQITPVLFTGKNIDKKLLGSFPDIEIIQSDIFDRWTPAWIERKLDNKLFFRDRSFDKLCNRHHIDLVSHITHLAGKMETPSIGWIPDFQHRHLPDLFTKKELNARDHSFMQLCAFCDGIILSSYDAKKDLQEFDSKADKKAHVLQFAVEPLANTGISLEEIEKAYGFNGKYFYVPNQFWVHKNHKILLEALVILKNQKRKVRIICTGNTVDYRNPHYYETLKDFIKVNNLSEEFMVLGKVPYPHVVTLSKHCKAFINPSFFEGWSTTVEEAKSIGKRIILSDTPVHKEQNPSKGIYFNPNDAKELAEKLWMIWESNESIEVSDDFVIQRRKDFARNYEKIVFSVLA